MSKEDFEVLQYKISIENINITMKGIEYLQENSVMKKIYRLLKETKDVFIGL